MTRPTIKSAMKLASKPLTGALSACLSACPLDAWIGSLCSLPGSNSGEVPNPAQVRAYQCTALRRTLQRAAERSGFYRDRFAALPEEVRSVMTRGQWPRSPESLEADMARVPFTLPGDLASPGPENGWRCLLCVSQDEVARMVTLHTSGTTTGQESLACNHIDPVGTQGAGVKRLAFSDGDLARTVDFFSIGMGILTCPGDVVLVLLPGADRPGGVADLLIRALARLGRGCSGSPFRPSENTPGHEPVCRGVAGDPAAAPAGFLEELRDVRPDCVVAAPAQLRRLLTSPEVNALASRGAENYGGVRAVLSSAEPLPDDLRAALSTAWDCEVFDHYGLTESGYGGGVECAAHDGYHWREADLWLEIVDPQTGLLLPEGQSGEVVITTLDREAMPLIRYRTGDVASILPGPCRCGSPLRRLGPVQGRLIPDKQGVRRLATPEKGKAHARPVDDHS